MSVGGPNGSARGELEELRHLLSTITPSLARSPDRVLEVARYGAKWILRDVYHRRLGQDPGDLRYPELHARLASELPRRIRIQLRAVASYRSAELVVEGDAAPSALDFDDVQPCLKSLDIIVRWYLRDELESHETIDFLPPGMGDADSPGGLNHTARISSGPYPSSHSGQEPHTEIPTSASELWPGASQPSPRRLLLLVPLAVVVLVLFALKMTLVLQQADTRLGFNHSGSSMEIESLYPAGPAERAGMEIGDVIVGVGGEPVANSGDYANLRRGMERGQSISVDVRRGDRTLTLEVTPGLPVDWGMPLITGFAMLCCMLLGGSVLYRRLGDLRSRLLGALLWLLAIELAIPSFFPGAPWFMGWAWAIGVFLTGLQMGVDFHLASVIPERQAWLARRPWVVRYYYLLPVIFFAVMAATFVVDRLFGAKVLPWSYDFFSGLFGWILPLWASVVLVLLSIPALRDPTRYGRLQARAVFLAYLPWAIYSFAQVASDVNLISLPPWIGGLFPLILLCFPAGVWAVTELESREQRRILLNLGQDIRELDSVQEVAAVVARDLDISFRPATCHIYFRREHTDELVLGYTFGPRVGTPELPAHFQLLQRLEVRRKVFRFPKDFLEPPLPEEEVRWLDELACHLLVPVTDSRHDLVGLLLLGIKRSEETYTSQDHEMLLSLAGQIALSFENIGLQKRLQEQHQVHREVLARFRDKEINLVKECPSCGRCYDHDAETCEDDGGKLELSVPVERTVRGRYRLDRVIGKGGIGAVYEAKDLRLGRKVAVKVLLGSVLDDPMVKKRFEREARIIAQLTHPNIVTLYDCGTTTVGNAFIVLELLQGYTLRHGLRRRGRLEPSVAADGFDQVLYGLMAAHSEGIVHRDLKPGNVFILKKRDPPVVKLLDFGVAKIKSSPLQRRGLTAPGVVLGTHGYMAPEQILGEAVDERADLYSVAVMVVEAISGQRPRRGSHALAAFEAISRVPLAIPNLPETERLDSIIQRCLSRDPSQRYPSAEMLRRDLIPALRAYPSIKIADNHRTLGEQPVQRGPTEKIDIDAGLEKSIDELRQELEQRHRRD